MHARVHRQIKWVCARVYVYIYIHIVNCVYECIDILCMYMYVYMHSVYQYVYLYIVYIYVCVYLYIHVYSYKHIGIYISRKLCIYVNPFERKTTLNESLNTYFHNR